MRIFISIAWLLMWLRLKEIERGRGRKHSCLNILDFVELII